MDLLVALAAALVLGLRHASDPDHLVAMTSLTAADGRGHRAAIRLGAGGASATLLTLLAVGLPLIALESALPGWLEAGAEKLVGLVIILLAAACSYGGRAVTTSAQASAARAKPSESVFSTDSPAPGRWSSC